MIQQLESVVISELRSGVTLTSFAQCVEELIYNSIDAASTNITIGVNMSTLSFEVSDNGTGLGQSDLKNAGRWYFTSKCHNLRDLDNASSYGFRGEALASLGTICQKLEVVSRHRTSHRTFCKFVRKGHDMGVYESTDMRPRHGTTVKATGVFYTLPVRQRLISDKVDVEQIRRCVLAAALMNPAVSFLLHNKENGCTLFRSHACTTALSVISQIFGCAKSKTFQAISQKQGACTVTGYVNLEGYPNKSFQFFYVNKRLVMGTKFHKITNYILGRGISGSEVANQQSDILSKGLNSLKKLDKYAGFIINLECPYNAYDITFDPEKTLVEFENWEEPVSCLKECLIAFLKKEGIFKDEFCANEVNLEAIIQVPKESPSNEMLELGSVKSESDVSKESNVKKRSIKAGDLRRSLCSATAKRKRNEIVEGWKSSERKNGVSPGHLKNSSELSEISRDERGCFKKITSNFSDDNQYCKNYDSSALSSEDTGAYDTDSIKQFNNAASTLKKREPREGKSSIPARLQRYSCPQSGANLSSNNCEQPSWESDRNLITKSHSGKRKCLENKERNQTSNWHSLKRSHDALNLKDILTSEGKENQNFTPRFEKREFFTSNMTSFSDGHDIQNALVKSLEYEKGEEIREKKHAYPLRGTFFEKIAFFNPKDVEKNSPSTNRPMNSFRNHREPGDSSSSRDPVTLTSDDPATTLKDQSGMVEPTNGTETNMEPSNKDSNWFLQYNPHNGRPVYVNLRTGNTSKEIPFCKPSVSVLEEPTESSKSVRSDLSRLRPFHPFAPHLSHNFTPWLPRSANPSSNQPRMSSAVEEKPSEIGDMLDQWINPVFERNEKPVTDVGFIDGSKTSIKVHNSGQPFKFTKDCFNHLKVISQVDNKFILCYYKDQEDSLLVVVDQHAAHERVRLENFIKDLYVNSPVSGTKMVMRSSPLPTPCILSMCDHDIHLMQAFRAHLQQVGIAFEDPRPSSSNTQSSVCINTVPSVFLSREYSDDDEKLRTEVMRYIEELIKEQIEVMIFTKGAPTTALPKTITRVLNSKACHGAIRFGDSLSTDECVNLMTSLSKCDLPFQCAHGRPSMIPLINTKLTKNAVSKKVTSLPQIWRIKKQMKETQNEFCLRF